MRKTLPILFLLLQCCMVSLWSQSNYPIYVTTSLLPPYSLNLSDYSAQGSQRLMVTIVVKDLDVTNLPVKLRIRMETAGVTIETLPTINTIPIYLDGGSATVLFGEDFVDYFNINNLQFKGYSKESYRRSGLLPEGFYRFSVEVLHFQTNRVISNTSTATAWMAVGKPPVLRSPDNGVELGQFVGMPISFSWLASSVGSPVSAGSVRYKFELWEVRVQGVNPYNVAASMPAIHEHLTHTTLYAFNPASVMMEEGMTYAWRVTAFDESGRMPFEQNGQSEVRTFVYKSKCDKVNQIQTTTIGQKGTFDWTPAQNHTAYNVEVRNKANNWFLASQTFDSKVEFYNLEPGHTYELRTQSVCNGDPNTTSDFSDWVQLVMPEPKPAIINDDCPDCVCDDNIPKVEITNFDLRTNLISGDTLSNKSGTTRFIIKNVEQQGADTYRGVFYFWSELWKIKIPCDFWDLQVNTDNVIVSMEYKSIYNPAFLLDLNALSSTVNELLDYGAVIFSDAQIADTIQVVANFDNIYVRDGQLIAVTLNPDGTVEETPLYITVEEAKKCLITNSNGDELVITSRGEVMGVKEYQQTGGGNNRLMNNYKKEKEANSLSTSAMVNFVAHPLQSFGFDKYTEQKQAIQHYYPALHNGYRPAFKSVGSFRTDRVGIDTTEGLHFRDEMGIPSVLVDGGMSVNGAYHGSERALYAYRPTADGEEEIVGKLNVVSFDEEPRRVHIISVNNARLPSVNELEARLNSIYRQAVCTWTVIVQDPVTLTFPGGRMTHGGSGTASTYNSDQRAIATAFESSGRQMEPGSLYLFFVEDVTFKDRSLAGYMPLQRQVGFIYGNPTLEVVAHELAHGAFMMRHTFSPKAFIIGEGQTQNLMDYAGGTELWKHQWDLIHNPESILFSWAQDEEEGEYRLAKENSERVVEIIDQIRNNNAIGSEYDFFLSYNESLNYFGRELTLGGKEYDFIAIQAPILNHEEGRKVIASNRFLIDDKLQYQNEILKDEIVAFAFQQYNPSCRCYTDAYFHIFVPVEDADDFRTYLFSKSRPIIDQLISDEYFEVQRPGRNCFQTCTAIVRSFDSTLVVSHNAWALATYNGTDDIFIHKECYQLAVHAMDRELERGRPVIVGVDYRGKSNIQNFDKGITDHWVIINGRGQNAQGVYYTYIEVAPSGFQGGDTESNRFVYTSEGYLEAINKTVNQRDFNPIITVIRLEPSSCACSRYSFVGSDIPDNCGDFYNHHLKPKGTLIELR